MFKKGQLSLGTSHGAPEEGIATSSAQNGGQNCKMGVVYTQLKHFGQSEVKYFTVKVGIKLLLFESFRCEHNCSFVMCNRSSTFEKTPRMWTGMP